MTYPLAVDRRARRRRNLLLLVILAIVVALVVLAVRYRTEERQTSDFLALAEELADGEMEMSASLTGLLTDIGDLERPDIIARLETLAERSNAVRDRLEDEAVVPRPAAKVSGLFSVAVDSWTVAVGGLAQAFTAVLDSDNGDETGDRMLARAFEDLRVGDAAYRSFLEEVDAIDPELVTRDFPTVAFASGDAEPLFDATVIAARLRAIRKLAETHDVAVTANTEPEAVTDGNGVHVLPVAESYTVLAVVTNEGNVGEESIEVSLRLLAPTAGTPPIEATELIPFLDAGEATTVPFEALSLAPGLLYELRIVASISDDADAQDNTFELPFFTNEAA